MKKGWMKYINKILCHIVMISMLIGIHTNAVHATSFSLTSNKSTLTPNETFKVTITVDGAGKFNIIASNASITESSIWCEDSCSFSATAGSVGNASIKVTAVDATGWDESPITGTQEISLNVVESNNGNSQSESVIKIQIAIAEKLKESEYTKDSWDALSEALANAKKADASGDSSRIDNAAKDLKRAIDSLKEINRSQLQDALNQANSMIKNEDMALWQDLVSEMNQYEHLLTSTDQQEIDDATKVLLNSLKEINDKMSLNGNNITLQQGDKYCNLILHNVWPILFFVSIGANILVGYMLVRNTKRRFNDDIPVVDYDINDDNV